MLLWENNQQQESQFLFPPSCFPFSTTPHHVSADNFYFFNNKALYCLSIYSYSHLILWNVHETSQDVIAATFQQSFLHHPLFFSRLNLIRQKSSMSCYRETTKPCCDHIETFSCQIVWSYSNFYKARTLETLSINDKLNLLLENATTSTITHVLNVYMKHPTD